jgi:hypothetical protein
MEKNWNYKGGFCKIAFVQLPDIFCWTEGVVKLSDILLYIPLLLVLV